MKTGTEGCPSAGSFLMVHSPRTGVQARARVAVLVWILQEELRESLHFVQCISTGHQISSEAAHPWYLTMKIGNRAWEGD